ncbi:hypothetical protein COCMIDRAFT_21481 [Bipolaris oryzae ATCC 44560]|uniref:Uncharacterized protein n=1 Tax=Bipolaris oryzae ATCC 44560 TaxID=930090 RepID=W6ZLZ0_COCMI|nr:uncharacterized protein COCMIDRAFT_21481 [Bipolaris oryzae ATCC 44560]EUC51095.1 hypothetical protein COCMIDRAFT_21481 [Bipolaris oryzae ATCC 44560]
MPAYVQSQSHQLSAAESVDPTTSPAASHALTATAARGDISLGPMVPPRPPPFALDNDQGAEIFQCNASSQLVTVCIKNARHTCLTTLLSCCYFHLSNSALGHDSYSSAIARAMVPPQPRQASSRTRRWLATSNRRRILAYAIMYYQPYLSGDICNKYTYIPHTYV